MELISETITKTTHTLILSDQEAAELAIALGNANRGKPVTPTKTLADIYDALCVRNKSW